jgi:thiamine biosynthesis protein ThiS
MKVRFGEKQFEFDKRMTAHKLLERLGVLPETVVVVKNDEIVTEDEMLEIDDDVELVRVVSGGNGETRNASTHVVRLTFYFSRFTFLP